VDRQQVRKEKGKKIVGFLDYAERDGGALTERSIRKAENGLPLGFSQLSKERMSVCRTWEEATTCTVLLAKVESNK